MERCRESRQKGNARARRIALGSAHMPKHQRRTSEQQAGSRQGRLHLCYMLAVRCSWSQSCPTFSLIAASSCRWSG